MDEPVHVCCVKNCSIERTSMRHTFHNFPIDEPDQTREWLRILGMGDVQPPGYCFLCSDHFEDVCFDRSVGKVRLYEGVVPTRNISVYDYEGCTPTHQSHHAASKHGPRRKRTIKGKAKDNGGSKEQVVMKTRTCIDVSTLSRTSRQPAAVVLSNPSQPIPDALLHHLYTLADVAATQRTDQPFKKNDLEVSGDRVFPDCESEREERRSNESVTAADTSDVHSDKRTLSIGVGRNRLKESLTSADTSDVHSDKRTVSIGVGRNRLKESLASAYTKQQVSQPVALLERKTMLPAPQASDTVLIDTAEGNQLVIDNVNSANSPPQDSSVHAGVGTTGDASLRKTSAVISAGISTERQCSPANPGSSKLGPSTDICVLASSYSIPTSRGLRSTTLFPPLKRCKDRRQEAKEERATNRRELAKRREVQRKRLQKEKYDERQRKKAQKLKELAGMKSKGLADFKTVHAGPGIHGLSSNIDSLSRGNAGDKLPVFFSVNSPTCGLGELPTALFVTNSEVAPVHIRSRPSSSANDDHDTSDEQQQGTRNKDVHTSIENVRQTQVVHQMETPHQTQSTKGGGKAAINRGEDWYSTDESNEPSCYGDEGEDKDSCDLPSKNYLLSLGSSFTDASKP